VTTTKQSNRDREARIKANIFRVDVFSTGGGSWIETKTYELKEALKAVKRARREYRGKVLLMGLGRYDDNGNRDILWDRHYSTVK